MNKFLTKKQAADYLTNDIGLRTSVHTLSKMITYGNGPRYHKVGRRVLYPITELDSWATQKLSVLHTNSNHTINA